MKCIIIIGIGCGEKLKSTRATARAHIIMFTCLRLMHMRRVLVIICIMNYYTASTDTSSGYMMLSLLKITACGRLCVQRRHRSVILTIMLLLKNKRLYGAVKVYLPNALILNIYELHDGERKSSH